ncbi:MAG: hypothetical protein ACLQLG_10050 [Thermoguttaceae bacterium]
MKPCRLCVYPLAWIAVFTMAGVSLAAVAAQWPPDFGSEPRL